MYKIRAYDSIYAGFYMPVFLVSPDGTTFRFVKLGSSSTGTFDDTTSIVNDDRYDGTTSVCALTLGSGESYELLELGTLSNLSANPIDLSDEEVLIYSPDADLSAIVLDDPALDGYLPDEEGNPYYGEIMFECPTVDTETYEDYELAVPTRTGAIVLLSRSDAASSKWLIGSHETDPITSSPSAFQTYESTLGSMLVQVTNGATNEVMNVAYGGNNYTWIDDQGDESHWMLFNGTINQGQAFNVWIGPSWLGQVIQIGSRFHQPYETALHNADSRLTINMGSRVFSIVDSYLTLGTAYVMVNLGEDAAREETVKFAIVQGSAQIADYTSLNWQNAPASKAGVWATISCQATPVQVVLSNGSSYQSATFPYVPVGGLTVDPISYASHPAGLSITVDPLDPPLFNGIIKAKKVGIMGFAGDEVQIGSYNKAAGTVTLTENWSDEFKFTSGAENGFVPWYSIKVYLTDNRYHAYEGSWSDSISLELSDSDFADDDTISIGGGGLLSSLSGFFRDLFGGESWSKLIWIGAGLLGVVLGIKVLKLIFK